MNQSNKTCQLIGFLVFCGLIIPIPCQSQPNHDIWYLYRDFQLDFSSGEPVVSEVEHNIRNRTESSTIVTDSNGDMIFYTDGTLVWDRNHDLMPSSTPIVSELNSTTQGVAVIQSYKNTNLYYLISLEPVLGSDFSNNTLTETTTTGRLFLSSIDMSSNGGLGDVSDSPVQIGDNYVEKMQVVPHPCNGVWIILHKRDNNSFEVLHFDEGVIIERIESRSGSNHPPEGRRDGEGWIGEMRLSSQNILTVLSFSGKLEFFRFNPSIGTVSDPITISSGEVLLPESREYYSCVFSPSGRYLYIPYIVRSDLSVVVQYDLMAYNLIDIMASEVEIGQFDHPLEFLSISSQLAPDGKIYLAASPGYRALSTIESPEAKGIASDFRLRSLSLDGRLLTHHNIPVSCYNQTKPPIPILPRDTSLCLTPAFELTPLIASFDSILWSTGATSNDLSVVLPGVYNAEVYIEGCVFKDSISILGSPTGTPDLFQDIIKCKGELLTLVLPNMIMGEWSTGDMANSIDIISPGIYSVSYSDSSECRIVDSLLVTDEDLDLSIVGDSLICPATKTILEVVSGDPSFMYEWTTGSIESNIMVSDPATYGVTIVTSNDCTYRIEQDVIASSIAKVDLGIDRSLCNNESLIAGVYERYRWSTGEVSSTIIPLIPGVYALTVTDSNNCVQSDSVRIIGIREVCDCNIYIPTAFNPNSRLGNNSWYPVSNCNILDFSIEIFDRWGNLVYQSIDPQSMWDATMNGQTVAVGTYTYSLSYRFDQEAPIIIDSGTVLRM